MGLAPLDRRSGVQPITQILRTGFERLRLPVQRAMLNFILLLSTPIHLRPGPPMKKLWVFLTLLLVCPATVSTQTAADSVAIRRAALDYIEGWYSGDAAQMQRALHPDLAKRYVRKDAKGESWLSNSTADGLVHSTRLGHGKDVPPEQQQKDARIVAVDGDMAMVKLTSTKLIDYMHVARWNGEWKIVNVLWDFRPESRPKP